MGEAFSNDESQPTKTPACHSCSRPHKSMFRCRTLERAKSGQPDGILVLAPASWSFANMDASKSSMSVYNFSHALELWPARTCVVGTLSNCHSPSATSHICLSNLAVCSHNRLLHPLRLPILQTPHHVFSSKAGCDCGRHLCTSAAISSNGMPELSTDHKSTYPVPIPHRNPRPHQVPI